MARPEMEFSSWYPSMVGECLARGIRLPTPTLARKAHRAGMTVDEFTHWLRQQTMTGVLGGTRRRAVSRVRRSFGGVRRRATSTRRRSTSTRRPAPRRRRSVRSSRY